MKSVRFSLFVFWASVAVLFGSSTLQCQQLCSTEKVNGDCIFTVDRLNPLQPPTLQMYPGATVTVKIFHALPFEQVSFDWQNTTGASTPDQASAVANSLSANIQKFVAAIAAPAPAPVPPPGAPAPSPDNCANVTQATAVACVTQMIADARQAAADIESLVNDDTLVYDPVNQKPIARKLADFDNVRTRILCRVFGAALPPTLALNGFIPIHCAPEYHDLVAEQQSLSSLVSNSQHPITQGDIPTLVNYTNTLVSPLEAIAQDLRQINSAQSSNGIIGTIVDPVRSRNPAIPSCNSSLSMNPDNSGYAHLLQRQVTCAVNVYNLVANSIASVPTTSQKRTIITISVNYTDSRVETSAGVMFSALPSRSFVANPAYSGTPPTVSNITVQEKDSRPLVVPFAAAHVRLGSDWLWPDRRRGAIYATFLVGVNPNTTTADFGAGLSVSWRLLMLSPVAHFAHDVRLTDGFTNGESLGSSFSGSIQTQQFWTTSFGFGIGVRVPPITGR